MAHVLLTRTAGLRAVAGALALTAAACGVDVRRPTHGTAKGDAASTGDTALGNPEFGWFAFNGDVGTAVLDSTGTFCLSSPSPALGKGERVWLIDATASPQRVAEARVTRGEPSCVMSDAGQGERGYLLADFTGGTEVGQVLIALTHPIGLPNVVGSRAVGDIDGDERAETFRACTSGEGVHLSIWSAPRDTTAPLPRDGSPPGDRRWHRYHNLGEDQENTCSPGETR